MKRLTSMTMLVIALISGALFIGCQDPQSPVMTNPVAPSGSENAAKIHPTTGLVTVIHGVPGLVVDVYVNGAKTLPSFAPNTVTSPLELPEGNYDIVIVPEGGDPVSPAISGSAFLPAGANVSIVAHLTEAGAPTLSVFVNDVSRAKSGKSRLVVRHTAAAPTVDISLERRGFFFRTKAKIEDLSNPGQRSAVLLAGKWKGSIFHAGSNTPVFGPANLQLNPSVSTIVYAVGSLSDGTFTLLTQQIKLRRGY
jgi:hypothetical protein